jgi:hypothetical protein
MATAPSAWTIGLPDMPRSICPGPDNAQSARQDARIVRDVLPGVAAYIAVPLALLGFRSLQAPTIAGRAIMDRIEGFRQYLGVRRGRGRGRLDLVCRRPYSGI